MTQISTLGIGGKVAPTSLRMLAPSDVQDLVKGLAAQVIDLDLSHPHAVEMAEEKLTEALLAIRQTTGVPAVVARPIYVNHREVLA